MCWWRRSRRRGPGGSNWRRRCGSFRAWVLSAAAAEAARAERQDAGAEINLLAVGLVLAFTAIAVANTLAMLRLAGAKRRQVLRLRVEALAVLLTGTVLGSGIALAVLTAFSVGRTGAAAPAVLPVAYVVVGVAGLPALAGTAVPGRTALRIPRVDVAAAKCWAGPRSPAGAAPLPGALPPDPRGRRGWIFPGNGGRSGGGPAPRSGGDGPECQAAGVTGRPADFQDWKPPVRSVARWRPRAWREAAARLEA